LELGIRRGWRVEVAERRPVRREAPASRLRELLEQVVRSRRRDDRRALVSSEREPPGVPPRALVGQPSLEPVDLPEELVELLELMHPRELKAGESEPSEPDDLEREAPIGRADALVGLLRLLLEARLERIGDRDACALVLTDIAGPRHGQEHDGGPAGRPEA